MGKTKIVLNRKGVRELMQSDEMQQICNKYANDAIGRLGDGYEVTSNKGKTRVNASVKAVSKKAKRENRESNTIMKAVKG